jgi:hypothetical protein
MKFNFIGFGRQKWSCSRNFIIGMTGFVIGFAVAWIMWSTTVDYMMSVLR